MTPIAPRPLTPVLAFEPELLKIFFTLWATGENRFGKAFRSLGRRKSMDHGRENSGNTSQQSNNEQGSGAESHDRGRERIWSDEHTGSSTSEEQYRSIQANIGRAISLQLK